MALSPEERRFLRSWEEQRNGGKTNFVAIYSFAYTLVIFLSSVAMALFMNIAFIRKSWLIIMALVSLVAAFLLSHIIWWRQQKKWRRIISREMEGNQ